jgi:penicillin-binding protein 1A
LQTAVNTGTGRAAQIGRPVAGKTGTTTSSKDGWFLGFSSGLTTGVWMGRDDARPIAGLHGGTAPARAFQRFMSKAVASRPIEQFETAVTLPEAQLEPDAESYYGAPDNSTFVDQDGYGPEDGGAPPQDQGPVFGPERPVVQPLPPRDESGEPRRDDERLDQDWLDRVTGQPRRDAVRTPPPRGTNQPYQPSGERPNQ